MAVEKKTTKKTNPSSNKATKKTTPKKEELEETKKTSKKSTTSKTTKKKVTSTKEKELSKPKTTPKKTTKKSNNEPKTKSKTATTTNKKTTSKKTTSKEEKTSTKTTKKTSPKKTSSVKKTTSKKKTESSEVEKTKKTTPRKSTTKRPEEVIELPKIKEQVKEEKAKKEEDLIITRQLDINLENYTYNHEGLVEKVKEILQKENEENAQNNLEDPLKGEELFQDIFKDNKNIFTKVRKKIKDKYQKSQIKSPEEIAAKQNKIAKKELEHQQKLEKENLKKQQEALKHEEILKQKEELKKQKELKHQEAIQKKEEEKLQKQKKLAEATAKKQEKIKEKEKLPEVPKEVTFKTREDKYKNIILPKQKQLEEQEKLRKELFENTILKDSSSPKEKEEKKSSIPLIILLIIILFLGLSLITLSLLNNGSSTLSQDNDPSIDEQTLKQEEQEKKEQQLLNSYLECLTNPLPTEEYSEELQQKIIDLDEYLKTNYQASVKYVDLTYGYNYEYNANTRYYAASTIKLVDALYIYSKASTGEINLDDTMTYTKKYSVSPSKAMKQISIGTKVTIRDLVKYAVEVSDNSAHLMLVDYIGYSNLKEYGESLGATSILDGTDKYGYITVNDAIIYLKALNEFINNNSELGAELQSFFLNAEQNDLELIDLGIKAAHKYGEYGSYYHDIGIVYDSHPYVVAILTKEGNSKNFEDKVKDINNHLYELHQAFYTEHQNACKIKVYGK